LHEAKNALKCFKLKVDMGKIKDFYQIKKLAHPNKT